MINGHFIYLEPLLRAIVLFVVVVVGSTFALRTTRSDGEHALQQLNGDVRE